VITPGAIRDWMREIGDRAYRLVHRYSPISHAVRHVITLGAFDLALILAAQAFLTIVPLLIVLAAFAPHLLGIQLSNALQLSLGLSNSSLAFQDMLAGPGHAARVGGVLGFVLVVSAGTSTANALQRGYERIWGLRRLGLLQSAWRSTIWLSACVLAFALSGLAADALKDTPGSSTLAVLVSLAGGYLFWWWTPHLLLAGRVGWRALLPSGALTGGVLVALIWLSPLVMPGFVASSEYEFGPLGTVFVVMLWLTIVCSIVVFCAIVGHVITSDERMSRLIGLTNPPTPALGNGDPGSDGHGHDPAQAITTAADHK
jgi:membrane protein